MPDILLNELRDAIAKRQVVVIAGAGVSVGATKGERVASWTGLLEDGVERCVGVSFELSITDPRMTDAARRLLFLLAVLPDGIAHEDLERLLPGALAAAGTLRQVGLAFDERDRLLMLAPLREYVRAKHPPAQADLARAVAHYGELAKTMGPQAGREGGADAVKRLAAEAANLEAMILVGLSEAEPAPSIWHALGLRDFVRFSGLGTTRVLEEARDAAKRTNDNLAEAQCAFSLGRVAFARSDHEAARARFEEALTLYSRIPEPYSIGTTHRRLARIAVTPDERRHHVHAAREAWNSIGRPDLVQELAEEFGDET